MKWSTWLKQSNSIILEYDHIPQEQVETFEEQIAEVEKYYQFSTVEEISKRTIQKKRQGLAAITFSNPRVSVILRALPWLRSKKIPFTIFLRADCIGLNKLPVEEEIECYIKKYPEISKEIAFEVGKEESFLKSLRSQVGALPVDILDPTQFFCTWGKLKEIPKELVEWGVSLYLAPEKRSTLDDEILFMRHQLGVTPKVARAVQAVRGAVWGEQALRDLKIAGCVTGGSGAVTQESQWWNLPYWRFST